MGPEGQTEAITVKLDPACGGEGATVPASPDMVEVIGTDGEEVAVHTQVVGSTHPFYGVEDGRYAKLLLTQLPDGVRLKPADGYVFCGAAMPDPLNPGVLEYTVGFNCRNHNPACEKVVGLWPSLGLAAIAIAATFIWKGVRARRERDR